MARLRDGKEGGNTSPGICQPDLGVGKGGLGEFERLCKEKQRFLLGMGAWAGSGQLGRAFLDKSTMAGAKV